MPPADYKQNRTPRPLPLDERQMGIDIGCEPGFPGGCPNHEQQTAFLGTASLDRLHRITMLDHPTPRGTGMNRIVAAGILALITAQPGSAQDGGMADKQTPAVIDQGNAEHYVWGEVNDGWHLLKHPGLSIIRERMVPGGAEVPHRHAKARQFFQVLAGELSIRTETAVLTIKAGQGSEIAPGLLHQAINGTNEPVEFLVVSMPPSHGDRIEGPFPAP